MTIRPSIVAIVALAACANAQKEEPFDPDAYGFVDGATICDGSDDVRLYAAEWYSFQYGYDLDRVVMADGVHYLKIDGKCRFYAYTADGPYSGRWYDHVYTGVLSPDTVSTYSDMLNTGAWDHFPPEDMHSNNVDDWGWTAFFLPGEGVKTLCTGGCQGAAWMTRLKFKGVISVLQEAGEPFVPDQMHFSVTRISSPLERQGLDWGGSMPLEDVVYDPNFYIEDPGHHVRVSDEPWFLEALEHHRDTEIDYLTRISINEPGSATATHSMVIRAVTPPVWEEDIEEYTALGFWPPSQAQDDN